MNTLSQWAYHAISKHFNKIVKHEAGVLENQDIEEIHQMRVGMRRLRSALDGFALVLDLPERVTIDRVGKIARVLGGLRDLDVMNQMFESLFLGLPAKEIEELDYFFKTLKQDRRRSFTKVKKILSANIYINLKQELKSWLDNPKYSQMSNVDINAVLPEILLPQVSNFLLNPTWYFSPGSLESNEYKQSLHDLRKEAKKLRYNLELFNQGSNDNYQYYLGEIANLQTILGNIQDDIVLREFLEETCKSEPQSTVPVLYDILQKNYLQHRQAWQECLSRFLTLEFRKSFYLSVLNQVLD